MSKISSKIDFHRQISTFFLKSDHELLTSAIVNLRKSIFNGLIEKINEKITIPFLGMTNNFQSFLE